MKYFIVTYGCQMNVHESEKIAGILEKLGYSPADRREDADIIVFNTCAIREGAEDRVLGNVGNLKKLKKKNKNLIIAVCGCMTQKERTATNLLNTFPFIDIVIGTFNLPKLGYYIEAVKKGRELFYDAKVKASVSYCYDKLAGIISEATALEDYQPKDYAMEVLFARSGEELWDIAKNAKVKEEQIVAQNADVTFPCSEDTTLILFFQRI